MVSGSLAVAAGWVLKAAAQAGLEAAAQEEIMVLTVLLIQAAAVAAAQVMDVLMVRAAQALPLLDIQEQSLKLQAAIFLFLMDMSTTGS